MENSIKPSANKDTISSINFSSLYSILDEKNKKGIKEFFKSKKSTKEPYKFKISKKAKNHIIAKGKNGKIFRYPIVNGKVDRDNKMLINNPNHNLAKEFNQIGSNKDSMEK